MTALQADICQQSFRDVEPMLHSIVHRFCRLYGGDYEERFSEACEHFMDAYVSYDSERGTLFSTWVFSHVSHRLMDSLRKHIRKVSRSDETPVDLLESEDRHSLFFLIESLSDDARCIAQVALSPPIGLREQLRETNFAASYRKILREYLITIGWTKERVLETFEEIGQVLTSRNAIRPRRIAQFEQQIRQHFQNQSEGCA